MSRMRLNIKWDDKLVRIVVLVAGLYLLAYYGAIKKTWLLWRETSAMEKQSAELKEAPQQIQLLTREKQLLDRRIGTGGVSTHQENIFDYVTNYSMSKGLKIRQFPSAHTIRTDQYLIDTYTIELEGDFRDQLEFVNTLERRTDLGTVSGVAFNLKRDALTSESRLTLTVYLQAYKSLKS